MTIHQSPPEQLRWHVSRKCDGGGCVRVAHRNGFVLIGSTRSPEAPINEFTAGEWHQFVTAAKMGAFDGLA